MLRGTLSRSEKVRSVKLSEPQAAAVTAATLEGETKDETIYRLVRIWRTEGNETIKPIPVGTRIIPAEGGKPAREKRLPKVIQYSGQLHTEDCAKLSDLVRMGTKAQDTLEEWVTCGAQLPQPHILLNAEDFYVWLSETYPHDKGTPLEGVMFDCWGRLSYRNAIQWLEELETAGRIWLYSWPLGQKTLRMPGGKRPSWLEFKPRQG